MLRLPWRGRRGFRLSAVCATIAAAVALPLFATGQANADIVRQKEQWVLDALDLPAAWQITQGRGVMVAVIDSGVDPAVSDLSGSVITGPDLSGVHTPPSNPNWGAHGTWMASLIAGHGNGQFDEDGIVGVAPRARILSIRVITDRSDPAYTQYQDEVPGRGQHELAAAIKYAVNHHAKVISMSLGYNAPSLVVRSALQYATTRNVVVVASAGNAGSPQTARGHGHAPYSFPADYPGVIGVAAVGRSGLPAYFSSDNLSVQVAAPGVNVPAQGRGSHYWIVSGTSPACALAAGVAALIDSKYPRLSASQVRRAIIWSAANRPPGGYDDEVGFGTVDAVAALRLAGRQSRQDANVQVRHARAVHGRFFGGGRSGVPPVPVPARGTGSLLIWSAFAAVFLLLTLGSFWRLAKILASRRTARRALPVGPADLGWPAADWPGPRPSAASRQSAPPAPGNGIQSPSTRPYPSQADPGRAYPGEAYPGQAYPGQAYPGEAYPGEAYPGEAYPGEAYPGEAYPGEAYPGEAYPGEAYPGPGQAYPGPGQAYPGPGQAYPGPGQAYPGPGQAYPGPGQPYPGPGQPYPGQPQAPAYPPNNIPPIGPQSRRDIAAEPEGRDLSGDASI